MYWICPNCNAPLQTAVCSECLNTTGNGDCVVVPTAYINCTPHAIVLNDGTTHQPSGQVARVSSSFSEFVDGVCCQQFGEVTDLPEPRHNTRIIVSALVLAALAGTRPDVVAPATGHPACVRNDKGQIVSVPGFVC